MTQNQIASQHLKSRHKLLTTTYTQAIYEEFNSKLYSQNFHTIQKQDRKPMCCSQCSFWVENHRLTCDLSCKVAT